MITLNLVKKDKSKIGYELHQFPDGQQSITLDSRYPFTVDGEDSMLARVGPATEVKIISRLNSFRDLELIVCATKALRRMRVRVIHLFVPYLLGARSDRKFKVGQPSYLVDVVAPIINSLNFDSVTTMDVHSDVAAACIPALENMDNADLVRYALNDLYKEKAPIEEKAILISPDGGSLKKIYKLTEGIGYTGDIITCSKSRDENGNLTRVVVTEEDGDLGDGRDAIIVDDICDGGATFINLAKEIRYQMAEQSKLLLVVTHGIFSKGFGELQQYFDGIYCTNSYQDLNPDTQSFVKQFNVF